MPRAPIPALVFCSAALLFGGATAAFAAQPGAWAAAPALNASQSGAQETERNGRVVLALPFDNRSGQANIEWIGESFAETLSQRLASAGFLTIGREDRRYALDHLGLPEGFRPSRATTIRIAQTLDADFVLVGSYGLANNTVTARVQILRVNQLAMDAPLVMSMPLPQLLDLENSLAWMCAHALDPKMALPRSSFLAASSSLRLDAYESYIRGVTATTDTERIQRLQHSVQLAPDYAPALLALGKAEYNDRNFDQASAVLAKVPPGSPQATEAGFYCGLAYFSANHYEEAAKAFSAVAAKLPLPEVVNNQGVAEARLGRPAATPLLQRASTADPQDAGYHFNLAVSLRRRGDVNAAKAQAALAVQLRQSDGEARQLQSVLNGLPAPADFDPQERIRRTYSEAAVRQVAFELDQLQEMKSASLPPAQRSAAFVQSGESYLNQGLVLEAEREFQSAIAANPESPEAHLGLAEIRARSGNADEARKEAEKSLQAHPNAAAYLLLARMDLQANQLQAAASDVGNALRLEPGNAAAKSLRDVLVRRGVTIP